MPLRLEDRIRELCTKAVATPEFPELNEILRQLKDALSEHTRRMTTMAADFPASKPSLFSGVSAADGGAVSF